MKAYKGFNRDMTCRGFQYEEGKTYELPDGEEAELCKSGFHACEEPIDCFSYYVPATSVFHEVDLDEVADNRSVDSKRVGRKLTVGAKLNVDGLVKAQFAFVKEHTTNEFTDQNCATAGDYGAATAGDCGAATAGDYGAATSRGSARTGKDGLSIARGRNVKAMGGHGAVLVLCEEKSDSYEIKEWKVAVVDGETIKPDTWYKLENGEIIETED